DTSPSLSSAVAIERGVGWSLMPAPIPSRAVGPAAAFASSFASMRACMLSIWSEHGPAELVDIKAANTIANTNNLGPFMTFSRTRAVDGGGTNPSSANSQLIQQLRAVPIMHLCVHSST